MHHLFLAQLVQNISSGIGLLEGFGMLAGVAVLIVAAIEAKRERGLTGLWIALICAIVMGAAFYIVQKAYTLGGSQSASQIQQGNLN
jgi:hypothetical protein